MLLLALQVGVEQRLVALAAAPEHVVLAAELVGDLERLLHLRSGVGEHLRVRIRRGAAHVAGMGEKIGRAPEQSHARIPLQCLRVRDEIIEQAICLAQRIPFGCDVAVVEAPERRLDLDVELERGIEARLRHGERIGAGIPWPRHRCRTKYIRAGTTKTMPERHGKSQVILERPPVDDLRRVIMPERERPAALGPLVSDLWNAAEMLFCHALLPRNEGAI